MEVLSHAAAPSSYATCYAAHYAVRYAARYAARYPACTVSYCPTS